MATLDVLINSRPAIQGAAQVRQALHSISQTAKTAIGQMDARFNSVQASLGAVRQAVTTQLIHSFTALQTASRNALNDMRGRFDQMKASVFSLRTAIVGLGLAATVRGFIQMGLATERGERGLRSVTVSAAAAREQLDRIRNIADEFQVHDDLPLANSFRLLASNGIPDAEQALRTIANAAAQTGLDVETATTAVIGAQERQLRSLGVQLIDLGNGKAVIAFGAMRTEVQKTDQAMRQGLLEVLSKGFPQAAQVMGNQLDFQFGRVQDRWNDFRFAVMRGGLQDFLVSLSKTIADSFTDLEIDQAGANFADSLINSLEAIAKAAAATYDAIAPLGRVVMTGIKLALDAFTKLPPEIQALGILGYLWLGTGGRLALGGALLLAGKLQDMANQAEAKAKAAGQPSLADQPDIDSRLGSQGLSEAMSILQKHRRAKQQEAMASQQETTSAAADTLKLGDAFTVVGGEVDSLGKKTDGFFVRLKKNFKDAREQSAALGKPAPKGQSLLQGGAIDENAERVRAQMEMLRSNTQDLIKLEDQKRDLGFSPEMAAAEQSAAEALQSLEKAGLMVSKEKQEIIRGYFRDLGRAQQATAAWNTELQVTQDRNQRTQQLLSSTADAVRDLGDQELALQQPIGRARREQEIAMQLLRTMQKEQVTNLLPEELEWLERQVKAIAQKETGVKALLQQEQLHIQSLGRQLALQNELKDLRGHMDGAGPQQAPSFATRLDQQQQDFEAAGLPFDRQQAGADLSAEMDTERAIAKERLTFQMHQEAEQAQALTQMAGRSRADREAEARTIQMVTDLRREGIELTPHEIQGIRDRSKALQAELEMQRGADALNRFVDSFEVGFDQIERSAEQAWSHIEDGLLNWIQTGKLNLSTFAQFAEQELLRLSMRFLMSQALTGAGGASGLMGMFGSLFNTGGGGGGAAAGTLMSGASSSATGMAQTGGVFDFRRNLLTERKVPGFQDGGLSFNERMVKISEGQTPEAVIPLKGGKVPVRLQGGGGMTINAPITIITPDADGVRRSQGQIQQQMALAFQRSARRLG